MYVHVESYMSHVLTLFEHSIILIITKYNEMLLKKKFFIYIYIYYFKFFLVSCVSILQHTFIPVLPSGLIDFCCSPMPFIMGINPSMVKQLDHLEIEMEEVC